MGQKETLPINHSTGSHIITTAGGAAGGALKGGLTGIGAVWGGTVGLVGLVTGGLAAMGAAGATAVTATGAIVSTATIGSIAVAGLATGALWAGVAALAIPIMAIIPFTAPIIWGGLLPLGAGIGAAIGGLFGAKHGHDQVRHDRAAAHMVDAEVGAMQAQAVAMQAQATAMGATRQGAPSLPTTVYADSIENQGRVAGATQLARA